MSDPVLVLEYELTRDRAKAEIRLSHRAQNRLWWKRAGAGAVLFNASILLPMGDYVWAAVFVVLAIEYWFSITGRLVMGAWIRSSFFQPRRMRFELDDRGIVRRSPKQASLRYWWKSLRRVSEDEDGFDLNFGWQYLTVPSHAFADEDQRAMFRNFVAAHLAHALERSGRLARECAKLDRNEEQQLAEEALTPGP